MTRRMLALLVALVMLAAACGDDTTPVETGEGPESSTTTTGTTTTEPNAPAAPADRLAAARVLWADTGPDSYRLTTDELCFCPETRWITTVVAGEVISHVAADDESIYDPGARTMELLFDEVEAVITAGYATLELDFDPTTGALVRYWVDVEELMADEEHGVEVVSLEPLADQPTTVDLDVTTLTDDYGCGYGFAIGSADQDLAVIISSSSGFDEGPDISAPVTFPSGTWTAEVRVGSDLFANWCDDVIETSEPVPVIDQQWPLVAGTLTIRTVEAPGACDGTEVAATLAGATAESPSGERVELGDVDLVNSGWGCFAG